MATEESVLWEGSPSQVINMGAWIFAILTFGILLPIALILAIRTSTTKYVVSTERVVKTHGILSKRTENLELYRVNDVTLKSADMTHPTFKLPAVPKIPALTTLRDHIEKVREARGVRLEERF